MENAQERSALTTLEQAKALSLGKAILAQKINDINKFVDDEFMYVGRTLVLFRG